MMVIFFLTAKFTPQFTKPQNLVDRDRLIFGPRNTSSDTLVLHYDNQDGSTTDTTTDHIDSKPGIWNTPSSGLYPGKTALQTPGEASTLSIKERWKAFTQATTFHGMRYIFAEKHYSIRR